MMRQRAGAIAVLLAAGTLCLAACDSRSDPQANAPGSPGNNATEVAIPQAADGPPGGPSGIKGSAPHTGASGGDMVPGTTGASGVAEAGGRGQPAQPGIGLNGGIASANQGVTPSTPADAASGASLGDTATMGNSGSTNSTSKDAVGQR